VVTGKLVNAVAPEPIKRFNHKVIYTQTSPIVASQSDYVLKVIGSNVKVTEDSFRNAFLS